jgi:hypothetical protein
MKPEGKYVGVERVYTTRSAVMTSCLSLALRKKDRLGCLDRIALINALEDLENHANVGFREDEELLGVGDLAKVAEGNALATTTVKKEKMRTKHRQH